MPRSGAPTDAEGTDEYDLQLEVLADKLAACTPMERYADYHGCSPPLRKDGTMDPRDDPCSPYSEPMDTEMGRQLMHVIRHTPGGVALCEKKHRDRRGNQAKSKVGLTTVFDPENPATSDTDEDCG